MITELATFSRINHSLLGAIAECVLIEFGIPYSIQYSNSEKHSIQDTAKMLLSSSAHQYQFFVDVIDASEKIIKQLTVDNIPMEAVVKEAFFNAEKRFASIAVLSYLAHARKSIIPESLIELVSGFEPMIKALTKLPEGDHTQFLMGSPTKQKCMISAITSQVKPKQIVIENVSYRHGYRKGLESHFHIIAVAEIFNDKTLIEKQKIMHKVLNRIQPNVHSISFDLIGTCERDHIFLKPIPCLDH